MAETRIELDDAEIENVLSGDDGPVHKLLEDITRHMKEIAFAKAPVRVGNVWNEVTTSAAPPGWTKAGMQTRVAHHSSGGLYGSVNAPAHAAIFLEYPRVDRHKEPFLTTALWDTQVF